MDRKGIGVLLKLLALLVFVVAVALLLWSDGFTVEDGLTAGLGGLALFTAGDLV